MNIRIKNAFGIRNTINFRTNSEGNVITIFAPNGCGKTSISNVFKNFSHSEDDYPRNSIEGDFGEESLIIDDNEKNNNKINAIVIDNKYIDKVSRDKNIVSSLIRKDTRSTIEIIESKLVTYFGAIIEELESEMNDALLDRFLSKSINDFCKKMSNNIPNILKSKESILLSFFALKKNIS